MLHIQHNDTDSKAGLRHHAVAPNLFLLHNSTALCNVPWCVVVAALWVNRVGCGLNVEAVCPKDNEGSMEHEREDWNKDVEEPERRFEQVKEHACYANDKVVLCVTGRDQHVSSDIPPNN